MTKKVLKAAFVSSLPVLMGYLTMGFAAGVLFASRVDLPFSFGWAFLSSATSISGALQFLLSEWFASKTSLWDVALLTVCLNMRYAMYGLSLIERFKDVPLLKKLYLIWSLTDETYALEVENKVPKGEDSISYCLAIAVFDHIYWILGVTAGAITGSGFNFDNRGIDFAMTALFLVILTDQCKEKSNRLPAVIGIAATLLSRVFFPPQSMLIPAMAIMIILLLVFRRQLDPILKKKQRA